MGHAWFLFYRLSSNAPVATATASCCGAILSRAREAIWALGLGPPTKAWVGNKSSGPRCGQERSWRTPAPVLRLRRQHRICPQGTHRTLRLHLSTPRCYRRRPALRPEAAARAKRKFTTATPPTRRFTTRETRVEPCRVRTASRRPRRRTR